MRQASSPLFTLCSWAVECLPCMFSCSGYPVFMAILFLCLLWRVIEGGGITLSSFLPTSPLMDHPFKDDVTHWPHVCFQNPIGIDSLLKLRPPRSSRRRAVTRHYLTMKRLRFERVRLPSYLRRRIIKRLLSLSRQGQPSDTTLIGLAILRGRIPTRLAISKNPKQSVVLPDEVQPAVTRLTPKKSRSNNLVPPNDALCRKDPTKPKRQYPGSCGENRPDQGRTRVATSVICLANQYSPTARIFNRGSSLE
jgi:hypothetical protein